MNTDFLIEDIKEFIKHNPDTKHIIVKLGDYKLITGPDDYELVIELNKDFLETLFPQEFILLHKEYTEIFIKIL